MSTVFWSDRAGRRPCTLPRASEAKVLPVQGAAGLEKANARFDARSRTFRTARSATPMNIAATPIVKTSLRP